MGDQSSHATGGADTLSAADLDELRRLGHEREFKRGQRLVFEGDPAGAVLVIESGHVKIVSTTLDGDEMILAVRGTGQLLGDLAVVSAGRASAAAIALDDVRATMLPGNRYLSFLEARPATMLAQLRRLISALQESDSKLLELATADVERRLCRRLLDLAGHGVKEVDGGAELLAAVSQEELAGMCGASREAVARALRVLREAGLVLTDRRRVVIADMAALRARA